ncbi:glycosyltransferase family 8 protein [Lepidopterella palustris CBS 459.81]|uniref:Glycosyltransferase family 8 protein n=1 Tax=Lepidopterella palustris CBS 459.81 TaxID=1314670 RepID=A0A8E2JGW2_9PEZI|nr:glycosyltransferase family 8 protein [Lepidopterella palustris CBS 459.81]
MRRKLAVIRRFRLLSWLPRTSAVTGQERHHLISDGVTMIKAEDVSLCWWVKTGVTRWKDQFMKLRIFRHTEFDWILFINADTLITRLTDGIFNNLYMFAAQSDNALTGQRDRTFPLFLTNVFSAGFWLTAPSHEMLAYLISQSLLIYAFRRDRPMSWREHHYKCGVTWPSSRVDGQVATLHEKFWSTSPELRDLWFEQKCNMKRYFSKVVRMDR